MLNSGGENHYWKKNYFDSASRKGKRKSFPINNSRVAICTSSAPTYNNIPRWKNHLFPENHDRSTYGEFIANVKRETREAIPVRFSPRSKCRN